MVKHVFFACFVFMLFSFPAVHSTLRIDIEGRPKEEVLKKSYHMGNTQKLSPVTCHILVGGCHNLSGIVLDAYTVLTCAHVKDFQHQKDIRVSFHPHVTSDIFEDDQDVWHVTAQPILHPSFKFIKNSKMPDIAEYEGLGICCAAVPLNIWASVDFATYTDLIRAAGIAFKGVDLAILKLDEPLPFSEYPEILPAEQKIENEVALSLGYGSQRYNTQDCPPPLVGNMEDICRRHLISTHVNAHDQGFAKVIYGHYKGLLVNGDESFIPHKDMLKTEGLPVGGDSGGPLLMKQGDAYKLAGIFSRTWSLYPAGVDVEDPMRDELKDYIQPIFPTWVDVRHYKDWIESHMGCPAGAASTSQ